jgi:hypothetical protein
VRGGKSAKLGFRFSNAWLVLDSKGFRQFPISI